MKKIIFNIVGIILGIIITILPYFVTFGMTIILLSFCFSMVGDVLVNNTYDNSSKREIVINFLGGQEITRNAAWWLDTSDNLEAMVMEILLQDKIISDLVPGDDLSTKTVALHKLLYHELVVRLPEEKIPEKTMVDPVIKPTATQP